jgi:hypothetical protein
LTAHGGVPLVIEAFRTSGAAAGLDASVVIKTAQARPGAGGAGRGAVQLVGRRR